MIEKYGPVKILRFILILNASALLIYTVSGAWPVGQESVFIPLQCIVLGASIVFGSVTAFLPLYAGQIHYGNAGVYLMHQAGTVSGIPLL